MRCRCWAATILFIRVNNSPKPFDVLELTSNFGPPPDELEAITDVDAKLIVLLAVEPELEELFTQ